MTPLVSVLMPTYNRAEYLAEAIDSIQRQTYQNFEIIVLDDGSSDSTPILMRYFTARDPRIQYFRQNHGGIAKARNAALSHARGDLIAVMDSDDLMAPDRLKKSVAALAKPGVDFVWGHYLQADARAEVFGGVQAPKKMTKQNLYDNGGAPHATITAKRYCFEQNPYREHAEVNDDALLLLDWFKAGYTGKCINEPLMIVRYHSTSVSATRQKEIDTVTEIMRKELDAL